MSLPIITSYEVKKSRTDQNVPVVNGVHLHSIYNPFKEADTLIENYAETLKNKNEVLVLGLGFAYHINALIEKLTELHGENFKIIVIEPNVQVYDDCIELELLNKKNVLIYSGFKSNELFNDLEFVHFLLNKPAIIAHPPSFNLYQYYYKSILGFTAPKNIGAILENLSNDEIKSYLNRYDTSLTLEEYLYEKLPHKAQFGKIDFLAMALVEMTKKSQELVDNKGDY